MGRLDGKVAIVTGAGRGIGKAIALVYGQEGAKVGVCSRTPSTVDAVVKEITDAGGEALALPCDVSHRDEVFAAVDKTVEKWGTVDIMCSNAQGFGTETKPQGSTVFVACEETKEDELEYMFRSGALASLWFMKAVFPHMKKQGSGKVLNFCSTSGQVGTPGNTCYNMTKEAIRGLSKTAANEWGQYGITVNVVNPMLRTDAFEAWETARPEFVKELRESVPMRRLGDPLEDGGPLMVFLATEGSNYITGQTFDVNGGKSLHP